MILQTIFEPARVQTQHITGPYKILRPGQPAFNAIAGQYFGGMLKDFITDLDAFIVWDDGKAQEPVFKDFKYYIKRKYWPFKRRIR